MDDGRQPGGRLLGIATAVVKVKPVAMATKIRLLQRKLGRVRDGVVMVLAGNMFVFDGLVFFCESRSSGGDAAVGNSAIIIITQRQHPHGFDRCATERSSILSHVLPVSFGVLCRPSLLV